MLQPQGLPNLGSTCYLNALVQALVGLKILLSEDIKGDIFASLYDFAYKQKINMAPFLRLLPREAFDSHEALTRIMDFLPAYLFRLKYKCGSSKIITYYGTQDFTTIQNPLGAYKLTSNPPILIILKDKKDKLLSYPNYKLVSFIDHLGGHYVSTSLRSSTFYLFDDSTFSISKPEPNSNTTILFYELI